MKKVVTQTIEQTHELAKELISQNVHKIITLQGDLGSGKTTFAQGILAACFAQGPYTSPTFTIMKEYEVNAFNFEKIYHIDAYRVESNDMIDLGWQDIVLEKKSLIIIEWPENITDLLPRDIQKIKCVWISDSEREYTIM